MTVCAAKVQPYQIMREINLIFRSGGQEHDEGASRDAPYLARIGTGGSRRAGTSGTRRRGHGTQAIEDMAALRLAMAPARVA